VEIAPSLMVVSRRSGQQIRDVFTHRQFIAEDVLVKIAPASAQNKVWHFFAIFVVQNTINMIMILESQTCPKSM
jgi:hypothetical protein